MELLPDAEPRPSHPDAARACRSPAAHSAEVRHSLARYGEHSQLLAVEPSPGAIAALRATETIGRPAAQRAGLPRPPVAAGRDLSRKRSPSRRRERRTRRRIRDLCRSRRYSPYFSVILPAWPCMQSVNAVVHRNYAYTSTLHAMMLVAMGGNLVRRSALLFQRN